MIKQAYIDGVKAALQAYLPYPPRVGSQPRNGEAYQTANRIKNEDRSDKMWNMFDTKEAPSSPAGYGSESSWGTP